MVMRQPSSKPGLLTLTIKDKSALYLAYMPFVKNGGLFIPTNSNYRLGDDLRGAVRRLRAAPRPSCSPTAPLPYHMPPIHIHGNRAEK
jgi:type IV pilus assembly protein PilZ